MLISSRGKHGLSLMIDFATHSSKDAPAKTSDVCKRLGLSAKYAEEIIRRLTQKRLLKSKLGNKGGHYLSKPADAYSIEEIILTCEGGSILVVSDAGRSKRMIRSEAAFWADLNATIHTFMANITLDTFIKN